MLEFSEVLDSLKNKDVFFHFNSEFLDWTKDEPTQIIIQADGKKSTIEFKNDDDIERFAGCFDYFTQSSRLISWNYKNLVSYFKKKAKVDLKLTNTVYDLKILCSYFCLTQNKPEKLKDCIYLLDYIKNTSCWAKFENYYKNIYCPLFSDVIPEIENNCLVDVAEKKLVYSYYEIDGQSNGRMKNLKVFQDGFLPHNMGDDQKENLRTLRDTDEFVYFDYKHMEVSVLAWMSQDKNLNIILQNKDPYESIWKILTGLDASKEQRKICKNIFLPIIFGQGANSLSEKLKIDKKNANKIIYKLRQTFPVAFTWIEDQVADSNNFATDIFGRRRKFEQDELYKIKNFSVQSPSNMICLRKLVKLHEIIKDKAKLCFHLHDGYCVYCDKKKIKEVLQIGKKILEEEDNMFSGLKLKVSCQSGYKLNNLK